MSERINISEGQLFYKLKCPWKKAVAKVLIKKFLLFFLLHE